MDNPPISAKSKIKSLATFDQLYEISIEILEHVYGDMPAYANWQENIRRLIYDHTQNWLTKSLYGNPWISKACLWNKNGASWNDPFKFAWDPDFQK